MKICSVCDTCFQDSEALCFDPAHGELADGPYSVDIVSGYIIERFVASSSQAVIYQARQIEYGQSCVISIAEGDGARFLADAEIAAGLFHAGVAGVIESGELPNGSHFGVFEGLSGKSLRDVLQEGTLSLLDQIRIARHAAEGVQAIHSAGLLHGALRPKNVSIEGLGTQELSVKVHNIDLGSAFANGILSNRFSMDSSLDSLRYFAPERFRGETPTVQSDVYSLGVLLYELLSGHPPFDASSATALAEMHLNQKPPEIKIENFDLRMLLTHTLNESLQKQTSFRQSTADLFARQMRHIEQLATHVSTPPPAVATAMAASSTSRTVTPQPLPRKVESIVFVPAAESLRAASMPEPTPVEDAAIAAPIHNATETPAVPTIQIEPPMPFVLSQKRSRLKGMKKRKHSYVSVLDAKAAVTPTTLIDWQQPEDDVPLVEAVREELASSGVTATPVADEEITHVRPPAERIEIMLSEPLATKPPPLAAEFVPTLMSARSTTIDGPAVFGYQAHGPDLGKLPIYGVALFAFLIVGFGVLRLGTALADDTDGYIGESRPARTEIPAPLNRTTAIEPEIAVTNISAQPVGIPAPVEVINEKSGVVKEIVVGTITSKAPKPSVSNEPKAAAIPVRQSPRGEPPIVPSTLVITRAPGKPKAVVVTDTTARESRPAKAGSGSTRPRIVSVPD